MRVELLSTTRSEMLMWVPPWLDNEASDAGLAALYAVALPTRKTRITRPAGLCSFVLIRH
jgi:hypothetical protein